MKRDFALLTGSFLLCLATSVSAQSGSPPYPFLVNPFPSVDSPILTRGGPQIKGGRSSPRWKLRSINEALLRSCCAQLVNDKRRIYYLNSRQFRMSVQIRGIYTREDLIFFRFRFFNHSHLDYDVDSIRFFISDTRHSVITDTRHSGRAPAKVTELAPVYTFGNVHSIKGKSGEDAVIILPRFTLPVDKSLVIGVLEKNGGRHLQIRADNYTLVKARLIPPNPPPDPPPSPLKGE